MILAVTGITGHSGTFFLKELEEHAFSGTVRCLVRNTSDIGLLEQSTLTTEVIVGDNTDLTSLNQLTKGADVVMHIFNIRHSVNVLKSAINNCVPRIVMVHTAGIYSKYKMASGEYKAIEAEIECILGNSNIDVTILRPTMIFGDLCDHNIHKFIEMVDKLPIMPEIDHGFGRIRPVNARDLAKAYYKVCMTSHLPALYYDLTGERSLTLHELFDLIGNFLGKNVYHLSCPMSIASFGAKCLKFLSIGKVDYVEKVLRMGENRDYEHEDATRDFGFVPEPFNIGLKREVLMYKQRN